MNKFHLIKKIIGLYFFGIFLNTYIIGWIRFFNFIQVIRKIHYFLRHFETKATLHHFKHAEWYISLHTNKVSNIIIFWVNFEFWTSQIPSTNIIFIVKKRFNFIFFLRLIFYIWDVIYDMCLRYVPIPLAMT